MSKFRLVISIGALTWMAGACGGEGAKSFGGAETGGRVGATAGQTGDAGGTVGSASGGNVASGSGGAGGSG